MKICVLGSGAFGLAIASLLSKNKNHEIIVWTSFKDEYEELSKLHTHKKIFADFSFEKLNFSMDLDSSTNKASVIILAVPSNAIREVLEFVKQNDVKFIRLAFCDIFGTQKNISIMPDELERAFKEGVSFDASAIKGFGDVVNSDLLLFPDPSTLNVLPWRPQ